MKNKDLIRFRRSAERAAVTAGRLLHSRFGRRQKIHHKGKINIVTEMDHRSQDCVIRLLKSEYPEHDILSEEMPPAPRRSRYLWVIDPLDGTTNYAHGFPMYSVSIALMIDDEPVAGAVYCPSLNELFSATKVGGARLNGRKIGVSRVSELDHALLATGFPYDVRTSRDNNIAHFTNFARRAQAIRRAGSAALDLCYVASGRFDGFWEIKLRTWDVAAGLLVVGEAGGVATNFAGGRIDFANPTVLASNGLIHRAMIRVLQAR